MTIKLSEKEIKNLEELINSDDIECIMLANEITSTLDEELKFKYEQKIYVRILTKMLTENSKYKLNPPWFLE
jgi:ABC-type Zn uptake system ZnuABC Zn-binding protein ZnuA